MQSLLNLSISMRSFPRLFPLFVSGFLLSVSLVFLSDFRFLGVIDTDRTDALDTDPMNIHARHSSNSSPPEMTSSKPVPRDPLQGGYVPQLYGAPPLRIPDPPSQLPVPGPFDLNDPPPTNLHAAHLTDNWIDFWRQGRQYWNDLIANIYNPDLEDDPCVDLDANWKGVGGPFSADSTYLQCEEHGTLWLMDYAEEASREPGQAAICTHGNYKSIQLRARTRPELGYIGGFSPRSRIIINTMNEGWSELWEEPWKGKMTAANAPGVVRAPNTWAEAMFVIWQTMCRQQRPEPADPSVLKYTVLSAVKEPTSLQVMEEISHKSPPLFEDWEVFDGQDRRSKSLWQFFPTDDNQHFYALLGTPVGADSVQLLSKYPRAFATEDSRWKEISKVKIIERIFMTEWAILDHRVSSEHQGPRRDLAFFYTDTRYRPRRD